MGVNLDDVADVVNNCIPQLIFFGVVVAAAIIVLIAMAVNKKQIGRASCRERV